MATLKALFKLMDGYSSTISTINKKTDDATNKILKASGATDDFNDKLEATGTSAKSAASGLSKFLGVAALLAAAKKGMGITDEFVNTSARLNMINDGLQTQAELQDKIFAAANRSRGAYSDMANAVAKLQMLAGDAFGSNNETIAFTELLQKSFKVGGADSSQQSAGMLQLSQAMASGRLQGDEFVSISENAPLILEAISKYTGKSRGELKELSSEGAITADIIKNSIFSMADDINTKFETMPMTFADVGNRIQNAALQAFAPLIESISGLLNSQAFIDVSNIIINGIYMISSAIGGLVDMFVGAWPVIWPILLAIGIYLIATLAPGFIAAGYAGLMAGLDIAAGWIMANLPMLAIIATIALIIYALTQAGVSFRDVIGVIGGIVGSAVAYIFNAFINLWNMVADFINFLGNAFTHPLSAIQIMFQGWTSNILGFVLKIAEGIETLLNKIPGVEVEITSKLTSLKNNLDNNIATMKEESGWVEYAKKADYVDYTEFATKGSDLATGAYDKIANKLSSLTTTKNDDKETSYDPTKGTSYNPTVVKGTGSNGKVDVDMSDEDIQYLRDIAEREYVNKFSTATLAPNINVKFGDVRESADVNKVLRKIRKVLKEEIETAAEGVY